MIFGVLGGSSRPNVLVENRFGFIQCAMGLPVKWRIEKYLYPVVPPMIRCAQWRQPRTSWFRWNLSIRLPLYSAGGSTCRVNLCTYLTSTVEKINLATERVRDSDVRALTNTCPNITFLNLTETLVTLDVFPELATTWSKSMRYLSLPKRIATELNLASDRVRYFQYLEELPLLWRQDVVNPRDTPILAIIAQFKTTVDSMSSLRCGEIAFAGYFLWVSRYPECCRHSCLTTYSQKVPCKGYFTTSPSTWAPTTISTLFQRIHAQFFKTDG